MPVELVVLAVLAGLVDTASRVEPSLVDHRIPRDGAYPGRGLLAGAQGQLSRLCCRARQYGKPGWAELGGPSDAPGWSLPRAQATGGSTRMLAVPETQVAAKVSGTWQRLRQGCRQKHQDVGRD
ncbi:hypothetical protein MKX50_07205 [Paenibacillus sp. FSL W8-0186]|uniref:hypothetical protein n=1 Tax=Paenibacillus TaxID=44249 RepID=UPI001BCC66A2|nr:hypothetical protein [Paenibacillus woosongensis]